MRPGMPPIPIIYISTFLVQVRRVRPGTKSDQFFSWPDESLEEMDSTLAVQQFIQQTIRKDPTNIVDILNAPDGQVARLVLAWPFQIRLTLEQQLCTVKLHSNGFEGTSHFHPLNF